MAVVVIFGDDDPEDAWDAGDGIAIHIAVLTRWVPSIALEVDARDPAGRVAERIEEAFDHVRATRFGALDLEQTARLVILELWLLQLRAQVANT